MMNLSEGEYENAVTLKKHSFPAHCLYDGNVINVAYSLQ